MGPSSKVVVDALVLIERARTQGVDTWCLVTVSDESGKIINVEGTFTSELDALAEGQRQRNTDRKLLPPGEQGYSYFAVPYFTREEKMAR